MHITKRNLIKAVLANLIGIIFFLIRMTICGLVQIREYIFSIDRKRVLRVLQILQKIQLEMKLYLILNWILLAHCGSVHNSEDYLNMKRELYLTPIVLHHP